MGRDFYDFALIFLAFVVSISLGFEIDFNSYLVSTLVESFSLPPDSGGWIYEYQNLIAGMSALGAALITARIMHKHYQDNVYRKTLYVKAVMHDVLNDLCQYYKDMFSCLQSESIEYPTPPRESIDLIKDGISYVDKEIVGQLNTLFSKYQVFRARNRNRDLSVNRYRAESAVELAEMYILTENLFYYPREEKQYREVQNISSDEMVRKIENMILENMPRRISLSNLDPFLGLCSEIIRERFR